MRTTETNLAKLAQLPYFSRDDLRSLDMKEKQAELFLYRAVERGSLIRLRRGLFTTKEYVEQSRLAGDYFSYLEFLANNLVRPSYVTGEYILSKYELLTEAVSTITSLTIRRGGLTSNALGSFHYRNITSDALGNFETIRDGRFTIKRASKIQALVDYLYFRKKRLNDISVRSMEELRINTHLLSAKDFEELSAITAKIGSRKLDKMIRIMVSENAA